MSETRTFWGDFHGHSKYSDGFADPKDIPAKAVSHGLDMVALSDHDTISGLPAFLEAAKQLNADELKLLAIPAIEITAREGHLLALIPGVEQDKFLKKFRPEYRPFILESIEMLIGEYNAICILAHPEQRMMLEGVSIMNIDRIVNKITQFHPEMRKNLGIEIHNWMAQAFFWNRGRVEAQLRRENQGWKLAEFSNTDYHLAQHIGNGRTSMELENLSAPELRKAVVGRKTRATADYRPLSLPDAVLGSSLALLKWKLTNTQSAREQLLLLD